MKYITSSPLDHKNTLDIVLKQMYTDMYNFKFSINNKLYRTQKYRNDGTLIPFPFYEMEKWDKFFRETIFTLRHIFYDARTHLAQRPIWWGIHHTESSNTRKLMEPKTHPENEKITL